MSNKGRVQDKQRFMLYMCVKMKVFDRCGRMLIDAMLVNLKELAIPSL